MCVDMALLKERIFFQGLGSINIERLTALTFAAKVVLLPSAQRTE